MSEMSRTPVRQILRSGGAKQGRGWRIIQPPSITPSMGIKESDGGYFSPIAPFVEVSP